MTASLKRVEQRGQTNTSPPLAPRCCCWGYPLAPLLCAASTCRISCCTSANAALHCGQRSVPCAPCCCCCHSCWRLCAVPYTELPGSAYCACACCRCWVRACAALVLTVCAAAVADVLKSATILLALAPKLRPAAAAAVKAADAAADAEFLCPVVQGRGDRHSSHSQTRGGCLDLFTAGQKPQQPADAPTCNATHRQLQKLGSCAYAAVGCCHAPAALAAAEVAAEGPGHLWSSACLCRKHTAVLQSLQV
jgi:hypothetical protein